MAVAKIERLEGALRDIKHDYVGLMRYPDGSMVTCPCCERMQAKARAALEVKGDG